MTHALEAVCAAALLAFVTAPTARMQGTTGRAGDEAAIQQVEDRIVVAFNKHDAKAVAAAYAPDADLVDPRGYSSGRAQIETSYAAAFAGVYKNATLKNETIKTRFITPGVAVRDTVGIVTGSTAGTVKSRVTGIYVKRSGEWTLVGLRITPESEAMHRSGS